MDKKIAVKLYATLGRNYSIPESTDLSVARKVSDIIKAAGIPEGKVTILFIDGRHAKPDDMVSPGQTLSLFPPIGGG